VRAPELAALVADLSARLATQRSLPPARQITQALLNWISRARALDPGDLDMLLDEFAALYRRCRPFQLAPCLDELEHRGDDPRLGPRLVEFIADAQVSGGSARKVWTRMGQLVALTGDPRIVEPLATLVGQPGANPHHTGFLTERLPGYLARLEARPPGLPTSLDAVHIPACEQLAGLIRRAELREVTPAGKPTSRAQMLDAIRADPGADDIRLIYADWLQERGDPHGEFIALQYQRAHRPPSRKAAARERKLLAQHRNQWLDGLEKIVHKRSVVVERGFRAPACSAIRPFRGAAVGRRSARGRARCAGTPPRAEPLRAAS